MVESGTHLIVVLLGIIWSVIEEGFLTVNKKLKIPF